MAGRPRRRATMSNAPSGSITGAVLAGGAARRMQGQDKGLLPLCGKPLVAHTLAALAPQVDCMMINANRNLQDYAAFGHPVATDDREGLHGPLAGMLCCLQQAKTELVAVAPCDSPFLPEDLVARLLKPLRQEGAQLSVAHTGARMQPVFTLMSVALAPSIQTFLDSGGRKIDQWFAQHEPAIADFADKPQCFDNINDPQGLARAELRLRQAQAQA